MARELHKQVIKDNDGKEVTVLGDNKRFWDVADFLCDLEAGGEIMFKYDDHGYTVADYEPLQACEWNKDSTHQYFESVDDIYG